MAYVFNRVKCDYIYTTSVYVYRSVCAASWYVHNYEFP